ncbi:MAG: hypothetical protein H0V90_03120 [Blastocatellia bacterium]|nr:hypothetical protein [Blastocatellia bacterium]
MKSNRIIWGIVSLVVLITIAVTTGTLDGLGQEKSGLLPKATPPTDGPDFSKYGITDYDAVVSVAASESERRMRKSQRYDSQGWVQRNSHPETGKIGRYTEREPPPTIPTEESDLIVTGRIAGVTAHLSNDKRGVYSEFTVKVDQVPKNIVPIDIERGSLITVDRAGGVVRYPNGQTVLYLDSEDGLPEVGREYLMFLTSDKKSENYAIRTLYELQETRTVPLDHGRRMDDIKRMGKSDFVKSVREKLSRPVVDDAPRRNHEDQE